MRLESIRSHLDVFSIVKKRRTTIAHAFASALAPASIYKREEVIQALQFLGQREDDIRCVYCDDPAETWDHLVGLVKNGRFSGYGHVIGNLVPCCKPCNSAKGNKDWRSFLILCKSGSASQEERVALLGAYQIAFGAPGTPYESIKASAPDDMAHFERLQSEILNLMREADVVAQKIRDTMQS